MAPSKVKGESINNTRRLYNLKKKKKKKKTNAKKSYKRK
jgi:hypothetical protein